MNRQDKKIWDKLYEAAAAECCDVEGWEVKALFEAYLRWIRVFYKEFVLEVPYGLSREDFGKVMSQIMVPNLGRWRINWSDYERLHENAYIFAHEREEALANGTMYDAGGMPFYLKDLKEYDQDRKNKACLHRDRDDGE